MYKRLVPLYLLLAIFIATGILSVGFLISIPSESTGMKADEYDVLHDLVTPPTTETPDNEASHSHIIFDGEIIAPAAKEEAGAAVTYSLEELRAINVDFQGWLLIPDTPISLPVVQAEDRKYYVKHTFTGEYSSLGCLFLDPESISGSDNRVIHGHNLTQSPDLMFSPLVEYQNPEFASSHKYFYFTEPNGKSDTYCVFAVINFDINNLYEFNYLDSSFETEGERSAFIEYLRNRSMYKTDYIPTGDLLILSTCNRPAGGRDIRLLICAGKLPKE